MDALEEQLRELDRSEMVIRISTETRKYDKPVTLLSGIQLSESDVKELLSGLKRKLGVGGAWKDGKMMLQGNQEERAREFLVRQGYKVE